MVTRLWTTFNSYLVRNVTESVHKTKSRFKESLPEFPERFKGTIIEKWADYWKVLIQDYTGVFKDVVQTAYQKPYKTVAFCTVSGTIIYIFKSNPNEIHFRDCYLKKCHEMIFIGTPIRNPAAVKYLESVEKMFNNELIRRLNLGMFSIIWEDSSNPSTKLYSSICPFLKPRYLEFNKSIIDIGFLNRWWMMEEKLKDMDVNPLEWEARSTI